MILNVTLILIVTLILFVTLPFGQLQRLHNTIQMYVIWIAETMFLHKCIFDLDLWPCDLDLRSTPMSHKYLSYVWVWWRSNHPFMIYSLNSHFYTIAYLTLTFDLLTLTLCHLQRFIYMYPMHKFDEDPIIRLWFIAQTFFSHNFIFDHDLWPCDLDLRSTSKSHKYQSYV